MALNLIIGNTYYRQVNKRVISAVIHAIGKTTVTIVINDEVEGTRELKVSIRSFKVSYKETREKALEFKN